MHLITKKRFLAIWIIIPFLGMIAYPIISSQEQYLRIFIIALLLNVLFFSVVMHELAHGVVALVCGDPTAEHNGRLSLNPLKHLSIFGTLIVPGLLYLSKAPLVFGWAKPIPFNPLKLKRHPRDQVSLIVAGPMTNFLLSYLFFMIYVGSGVVYKLLYPELELDLSLRLLEPIIIAPTPLSGLWFILFELGNLGMVINITLGGLNLIPIPPLDGFWILKAIMPAKMVLLLGRIQNYGFILIFFTVYFKLIDKLLYPVSLLKECYQILIEWII